MKSPMPLDDSQNMELNHWVRSATVSVRWQERAQIILAVASGGTDQSNAAKLGTTRHRVAGWRARFGAGGVDALKKDLPRGGRSPKTDAGTVAEIIRLTTQTKAVNAHWSTRTMAERVGVRDSTVLRNWRAHGLKPRRMGTFKLSNDPLFAEKMEAIAGLYLSPP